jgi:4-amino-4-deoxy-L-arabinose transferase-like glycosyltransferase
MTNETTSPDTIVARGPRWHYLLVVGLTALIMLYNLGGKTLEDHEAMMALTARVMADPHPEPWLFECPDSYAIPPLTTLNHWMVPVENGYPRLVKTPLPYWLAGGIGRAYAAWGLAGEPINDFTARLGSALAAIALVGVTLAFGRRLFSPRVALLGAIMLAVSVGLQKWGKNARPEMMLCLMMTISMACFYNGLHALTRRRRACWMIAFWFAMGLANLSKEFVPLLLAWPILAYLAWQGAQAIAGDAVSLGQLRKFVLASLVGMIVYVAISMAIPSAGQGIKYSIMAGAFGLPMLWLYVKGKGYRRIVPLLPTAIPGFILMLAMFVPWMLYMAELFPKLGGILAHQVTERAAGTGGWNASNPMTYFNAVIVFTLPWLVFVPGAFAAGLMKRFQDDRRQLVYLLLWVVGIVLLFAAAAGKREHYILPTLPAMCLLIGYIADDVFFRHRWISINMGRLIGVSYGIVGLLAVPIVGGLWAMANHGEYWLAKFPKGSMHSLMTTIVGQGDLWPFAMFTCAALAVPIVIAGYLAWRGKLAPVVALLVAGFAIMHIGNWSMTQRWDDRLPIAQFAHQARAMIPQGQPVFYYGPVDPVLAYYFGQSIPSAQYQFQIATMNKFDQDAKLNAWFSDKQNAPWLMGEQDDTKAICELGYTAMLDVPTELSSHSSFILFHRRQD